MSLPRLRLRTLMIAVAIAGGLCAAALEVRRLSAVSLTYRKRAVLFSLEEERSRVRVSTFEAFRSAVAAHPDAIPPAAYAQKMEDLATELDDAGRLADHFAALRRKYERAASRPWESVPPDPPLPR